MHCCAIYRQTEKDAALVAIFKLGNECMDLIGARTKFCARRSAPDPSAEPLSHFSPNAKRETCPSFVAAEELTRLAMEARSHREKCATLLGIALNARLALEQVCRECSLVAHSRRLRLVSLTRATAAASSSYHRSAFPAPHGTLVLCPATTC